MSRSSAFNSQWSKSISCLQRAGRGTFNFLKNRKICIQKHQNRHQIEIFESNFIKRCSRHACSHRCLRHTTQGHRLCPYAAASTLQFHCLQEKIWILTFQTQNLKYFVPILKSSKLFFLNLRRLTSGSSSGKTLKTWPAILPRCSFSPPPTKSFSGIVCPPTV